MKASMPLVLHATSPTTDSIDIRFSGLFSNELEIMQKVVYFDKRRGGGGSVNETAETSG